MVSEPFVAACRSACAPPRLITDSAGTRASLRAKQPDLWKPDPHRLLAVLAIDMHIAVVPHAGVDIAQLLLTALLDAAAVDPLLTTLGLASLGALQIGVALDVRVASFRVGIIWRRGLLVRHGRLYRRRRRL